MDDCDGDVESAAESRRVQRPTILDGQCRCALFAGPVILPRGLLIKAVSTNAQGVHWPSVAIKVCRGVDTIINVEYEDRGTGG